MCASVDAEIESKKKGRKSGEVGDDLIYCLMRHCNFESVIELEKFRKSTSKVHVRLSFTSDKELVNSASKKRGEENLQHFFAKPKSRRSDSSLCERKRKFESASSLSERGVLREVLQKSRLTRT